MNTYWFKPKSYGYGFVPVTWEGWLATLLLIGILLLSIGANGLYSEEPPELWEVCHLLVDISLITGIATLFFERKMKEPLRWRWGRGK